MNNAKGYRDLEVWQLAMTLVEAVYGLTAALSADQRFGLTSQIQRAAVSIPSNIAEGHAKRSGKDYKRHLVIAAGSLAELETQLELCVRLRLLSREAAREPWKCSQRVAQMLARLIQAISRTPKAELRKPK